MLLRAQAVLQTLHEEIKEKLSKICSYNPKLDHIFLVSVSNIQFDLFNFIVLIINVVSSFASYSRLIN